MVRVRRIVMVRHHPAHMLGDDLVAPLGEKRSRLEEMPVALLDARDFRRADLRHRHAALAVP